ncbi:MAG: glycosyltransferase [Oscillatoriophycideae cyanobacterium NC_groundwater_1537_Pr4_S-0.65um_50_18]|nr:glycosyltransferase [Oscillatoriophycideae cyanobacterium NC_groundwater_1537_Pr4_S-0.65um_50_18]
MAKILILIGAHLCTAPRPQKEAAALAAAGHDVTVGGIWFDPALAERDRLLMMNQPWKFSPVLDFRPQYPLQRWRIRLQARFAREQFQQTGRVSPTLLGYGATAMLKAALSARADLTIVHSEAGLWVGHRLLDYGLRVGVDFEDWFSQDLLPAARATRPIAQLQRLEARLAQDCPYCLTTSNVLAERLAQVYQAPTPTVIYNVFPHIPTPPRPQNAIPTLHWFSQTIGSGRGLETLFQALPYLTTPVPIHLRGNCSSSTRQWINAQIPTAWRDFLFIHPTVSNAELPARIADHDIGLALELSDPPSRNLTVTNKLFQYLQSGLAMIATDTLGQQEVFAQAPEIGCLIPSNQPLSLAEAIEALVRNPQRLKAAQLCALQAAQTQFGWENQRDRLLTTVERALTTPPYSSKLVPLCVS